MISKIEPNRVRRTYRGGGRIDAFTGFAPPDDGALRPEDWLASTTQAFNGVKEIEGEGLGRLSDGRLVKDAVGTLPILVKLLDADERLVIQAHPTVPFARARMNVPVGKTECWYFLSGTAGRAPSVRVVGPDLTDKFEMWRLTDGGTVGLEDKGAVAVVTAGTGKLNGVSVRKGDRLVLHDEAEATVSGTTEVVVCK